MQYTLYGYWRSSATYRVRIALQLKNCAFDYVPVHLVRDGGGQHQAAYAQLNPAQLVPTLIDHQNGLRLNQSLAIIEYLNERHQACPLLPTNSADKARVRALALDIACDIQPLANLRVLQYLRQPFGLLDHQQQQWSRHWIGEGLGTLEQRLQQCAGDYCYANQLSLADLCLVPQVYNALRFNVELEQFPVIQRIYARCNSLAAFDAARPENQADAEV